jgi:hypothetical protein
MSARILVIISTGEKEKALTGLMYAKNTINFGWLDDVRVIFFGPSQKLMVEDEDVRNEAIEIAKLGETIACKFTSDRDELSGEILALGVQVEYVGTIIANFLKQGYIPMIW